MSTQHYASKLWRMVDSNTPHPTLLRRSVLHLSPCSTCSLIDGATCPMYDFHGLEPEPKFPVRNTAYRTCA